MIAQLRSGWVPHDVGVDDFEIGGGEEEVVAGGDLGAAAEVVDGEGAVGVLAGDGGSEGRVAFDVGAVDVAD